MKKLNTYLMAASFLLLNAHQNSPTFPLFITQPAAKITTKPLQSLLSLSFITFGNLNLTQQLGRLRPWLELAAAHADKIQEVAIVYALAGICSYATYKIFSGIRSCIIAHQEALKSLGKKLYTAGAYAAQSLIVQAIFVIWITYLLKEYGYISQSSQEDIPNIFFSFRALQMMLEYAGKSFSQEPQPAAPEILTTSRDNFAQGTIPPQVDTIIQLLQGNLSNPENALSHYINDTVNILFFGPPGTGKTELARLIAHETTIPFFATKCSDILNAYVGGSEGNISRLFSAAEKCAQEHATKKAIIFIDEIDALGRQSEAGDNNRVFSNITKELLQQIEGITKRKGIILIGSTNHQEALDEALLSRFSMKVEIPLPNEQQRKSIASHYLAQRPTRLSASAPNTLASSNKGRSPREIRHIVEQATMIAAQEQKDAVDDQSLSQALANTTTTTEISDAPPAGMYT